nr:hypothetical protein [uncultured Carboxylicivirga sp.]
MKSLLVVFFSFAAFYCVAQSTTGKKFFVKANVEYMHGISYHIEGDDGLFDYDSFYSKNLEIGCGLHLSQQFDLSINMGANRYEKLSANTFPLTLQSCYYLKPQLNSFFGTLKLGPQIKMSDASDKGYVAALHVGRRFKLKNNFALKAYVGYNFQKTTDEYIYLGKISRNSLVVGIEVPIYN